MPRAFNEGITDEKGHHDLFLWGFAVGVVGIVVLAFYAVYQGHPPSLRDFGESIGWLTGGSGAGYGLKRGGEKYGSIPTVGVDFPKD